MTASHDMDYEDYIKYNSNVYQAMRYIDELNKFLKKLPPYNKILDEQIVKLDDILNGYNCFLRME